jgi:hypothetical protein
VKRSNTVALRKLQRLYAAGGGPIRDPPPNKPLKLARPGFGPALKRLGRTPESRRHVGCRSRVAVQRYTWQPACRNSRNRAALAAQLSGMAVRPTKRPNGMWHDDPMSERYWLTEWMDTNGVKSDWHIDKVLKSKARLRDLREHVENIPYTTEPLSDSTSPGTVLVGGRGIDLSGDLECSSWGCKTKQVDRLFSRVWHYFDRVVVVGLEARDIQKEDQIRDEQTLRELEQMMRLLLYLRANGIEDMLIFRQKPPACEKHSGEQLAKAGLSDPKELMPRLAARLCSEGKIRDIRPHGDHYHYAFDHPTFMHSVFDTVSRKRVAESGGIKEAAARSVVEMYVSRVSSDILAARYLGSPFGSDLDYYRVVLDQFSQRVTHEAVALELELPVLDGVRPVDLMALRSAEGASFERFRTALKSAIAARLASDGSINAKAIAREIEADVIRPALADIEQRLKAAQSVLTRKAAIGLSIGALATTCGLVLGVPTLTVAGVGSAMTALQAEYKHIEERRDVQLADMYFLWRASHAH